ncbi:hypothetical protein TNCV_3017081 [Trichonephila clavipes]|nr:hypothetical protein TNCV_3017081 [Trichonephila clavipes]
MTQDCNPSSSRLSSSHHVFLASGFLTTVLLSPLVRSGLVFPLVASSSSFYSGPAVRSRVYGSTCCQVQAVEPYNMQMIWIDFRFSKLARIAIRDL